MAGRPEGQPKSGGRKKGTPNKRTAELQERLEAAGCDPLMFMAEVMMGEVKFQIAVGKSIMTGEPILVEAPPTPDQRIHCARELAQYIAPKRKAVEHSGPDVEAMPIVMLDFATLPVNGGIGDDREEKNKLPTAPPAARPARRRVARMRPRPEKTG